ncbi:MAG: TolC family protein, partial [Synergistaceae bacterium]
MKKTTLALAFLLLVIFAAGAFAEEKAISKDIELTEGQWTELAKRYPIPALSGEVTEEPKPELLASWWNSLGDETLTNLIMTSLSNNRDLASARASVTEARANLGITKAAALPWLDTTNYWNRGNTPVTKGGDGKTSNLYRLGVDASWEIDIF